MSSFVSTPGARRRLRAVSGAAALTVAAVTAASGPLATGAQAAVPSSKVLTAVIPHLDHLSALGAVAQGQSMTVGVVIPGNSAAQSAAYAAFSNPKSATYGQIMTPAEIASRFGVSAAVSAAVQKTVEADGLKAVYVAKDGGYVELTGTAAQVEKTFSVSLENYHATVAGKTGTYFANTNGATVPSAVSAVLGLSSFDTAHTAASQGTCAPALCTGVVGPSALWGTYDEPDNYVEADGNTLRSDANNDYGQGQKVAIFGEGDLSVVVSDLRKFEDDTTVNGSATDLKPALPHIPVRETLVNDVQDATADTAGLGEWDLDSQSSTGMSPDLAQLQFYFGKDLSDAALAGIYSAWVNDPAGAAIGNSSFGGCEPLEGALGAEGADDAFFQQAVMMGRTMFVSTGDTGSGGCVVGVDLNGVGNGGAPAVEYPAASPYVVGVGGTVVYTAASTGGVQTQTPTRGMEYAWTYTGGGSADFEPQPADQAALGAGSLSTQPCVMPVGSICRSLPDVAAMSGDVVTNGYGIESAGKQTETGGTSLSSPLWAGMWARVRAAHPLTCVKYPGAPTGATTPNSLGFAQHLLYQVALSSTANDAASFFDIGGTSGKTTPAGNGTYVATPRSPVDPTGYDLVSGLGTPDIAGLAKVLDCGQAAPVTTAVPNDSSVTIAPVSASSCGANGVYTDASGDEQTLPGGDTALDILNATFTTTSTGVALAMQIAKLPESNAAVENYYDWDFTYGGSNYEVEYDNGNAGGTAGYTLYVLTTANGLNSQTALATLTGGTAANGTPGTLSVPLSYSTFNSTAKPAVALQPGSVLAGVTMDTNSSTYEQVSFSDTLASNGCDYVLAGGTQTTVPAPPPTLPEVGAPALLIAVGALGGLVVVRRRRRTA